MSWTAHGRALRAFETPGRGRGGRASEDGKDADQVHIANTSNPLRGERYSLDEDWGGAGRHRRATMGPNAGKSP